MKTHSAPYVPLSKTREQIAENIAAGFPSETSYFAVALRPTPNGPQPVIVTPVHLRRA